MIPVKEINRVTGYIRGGYTSIGMKKQYVTRIDDSAAPQTTTIVSGGSLGSQIELAPDDLVRATRAEYADLVKKDV